ncbi:2-hydroxycarboxylate transporter family protein [Caballeronia sp. SEWSISQ10-4 2]|uniref:2-hydroxycarboxylate transporter family protein n=1 Tax=Caballeronia sp. SEWSISQ10-4 2 TaxID=2937438 RepID=UPI002659112F|nr:2-hydroxycarboxylate transporter family protein [Caballeronia sp. SEWSISQ10-4 2]
MMTAASTRLPPNQAKKQAFWHHGWWKLMEIRIAIIPLPIYVIVGALIAGLVYIGKLPNEISLVIVMFAFLGLTLAEIGKRILTAANRMTLMPFAQIATRIGGVISVTTVLIILPCYV